jgi:hypothetical protein
MKKTALLLTLTMTAFGCEQPDDGGSEEEAREAIPAAENLKIEMPSGDSSKPGLGDPSGAYLVTLGTAVTLNASVGLFLGMVKLITAFPVTTVSGNTYVWGPWHDEGKPGEYQLTVEFEGGKASWTLEARRFGEGGSFQAVVSGVANPGRPNRGSGSFTMDFEFARTIDPTSEGEGTLDVSYDLEGSTKTLTIDAEKSVNGVPNTFHYEYTQNADKTGALEFMIFADTDDPGTAAETVQWHSQWKATGAGRADAQMSGGDLGSSTANATECWSEWPLFRVVYYADTVSWLPTQGALSACAFQ